MAATVIKTTFQFKRGTADRWEELNLVLAAGEPGFEVDTNRFKIGNGKTPWNELPYMGGGAGGGDITIDMALSDTSLNPVANKVITKTIKELEGKINNYQFGEGFVVVETDGVQTVTLDFDAIKSLVDVSNFVTREEFETIFDKIPTKISELENDAGYLTEHQDLSAYATKVEVIALSDYQKATSLKRRYEVMPHKGAIVEYRDSEIRINTQRVKPEAQQVGPTGSANQYYLEFRAYAPEGTTNYKEWQGDTKDETLYDFNHAFAGTDSYGRNYSLIWFSVASWNGSEWSLYGDKSTIDKYLGFYYTFEWYNGEELIGMDKVRLILTNDECHNELVADPVARYIDKKVENTKTFVETQYATKEEAVTKEELTEEIENIMSEGIKVNSINYGTF